MDKDFYHPEDFKRTWDYDSKLDAYKYFLRDNNLNRYSRDYDKWEDKQRREHGENINGQNGE